MKILYGVTGEGMGHAIRSRVVLTELVKHHEVEVVSSGRAQEFLSKHFPEVHRIHGLHIVYEENRVQKRKTVISNLFQGLEALPGQIKEYFKLIEDFNPDVVISDFESWSYFFGMAHGTPVISIDNMQVLNRCKHPKSILEGEKASFQIAKSIVKAKLPGCLHYLVSSFFYPEVRKGRTTLVPPILRPEILAARSIVKRGDHLLVYQTAEGYGGLIAALKALPLECRIYGMRRGITEDQREDNLVFRPFSEAGFIEDVATSRGVVAGGGFTLMGEAVYLHKPMLAIPVKGQFEQVLNARYLQKLGFGAHAEQADLQSLQRFLEKIPACEEALEGYEQDGNKKLFEELDTLLDRVDAGLV
jgi:uncharacterized protein (TIGR00661 family)